MPIHEYTCENGHTAELFFKTFGEVPDALNCAECGALSKKAISVPLMPHLYGNPDGYHKPSATRRHSYKKISDHGNGVR